MSDPPSVSRFLSIPPANPSRGISHPATGKRILSWKAHHDPQIHEAGGVLVPYIEGECATDALEKFSPGHPPPVVQNNIPGTQIYSPENSRKI